MTTEHSGGGDLSRSLELLWGDDERRTRGPKPGLSLDRIVTAAVAVADAEGLSAVSMRRIAGELGVGAMSLYRYVPGKAELLDLMLDKVNGFDRETAEDPALFGWRGTLERIARGIWDLYGRHPWLVHVDQARPLLGPGALAGLEYALEGLDGLPLADPERMNLLVVIDGYVTGTARSRVNAELAEQRTGVSDEEFWRAQAPILERVMATGAYPKLAALSMEAFATPWEDMFEFGLRQLLDGMEAFIERRQREQEQEQQGSGTDPETGTAASTATTGRGDQPDR